MNTRNITALVVALAIPQLVGFAGSLFTRPQLTNWYDTINQSTLTPPDITFAIVWPTLFFLMGLASYIIWRKGLGWPEVRLALTMYAGQLILNGLWSWLFFGRQDPTASLWEIAALWLAILATTVAFVRISRPAAYLMLPYLLWVTFAIYLNWQIVVLN